MPCCYDPHWLIFLGLWIHEVSVFSTDGVSVKNLNTHVLDFFVMFVVWSVRIYGCFIVFRCIHKIAKSNY
jgi:hypothetical protein